MKKILLLASFILLFFALYYNHKPNTPMPLPTGATEIFEGDEEGNASKRQAWFDEMHKAAPGVSWQEIEYKTAMKRHRKRAEALRTANDCASESIADGSLTGSWLERGSRNQAGSVFDVDYDFNSDKLYLVSAGGTLFKGNRQGNWEVINQDFQFTPNYFKLVQLGNNTSRMVAAINRVPHYSDDLGVTWQMAAGLDGTMGEADYEKAVYLANGSIYLIFKPVGNFALKLFKSTDAGMSFTEIFSFGTTSMAKTSIVKPHNSEEVFVLYKVNNGKTRFYQINIETDELEELNENENFSFELESNMVGAKLADGTYRFYAYTGVDENSFACYKTEDFGANWELQGAMPFDVWSVGMFNSPGDPDLLVAGGLECWRSENAGQTWVRLNSWGEYYGNEANKLHADIMSFNEFVPFSGQRFQLISNHGGLSISYDNLQTTQNIGLSDLNVSQYYCVRSNPNNPNLVFAGSQDQGFQMGTIVADEVPDFNQVISGDYGQIVFSENGSDVWTVYPDGTVRMYNNITQGGFSSGTYTIDSNHESVWLPPMMEDPNVLSQSVYVGGGSTAGGNGSYMIRLTANGTIINAQNLDYNFRSTTSGSITAMSYSKVNTDRWYVATNNGYFFHSEDRGDTWTQSANGLPQAFYLYGQAIWPSAVEENTVYFAGTGYSNPGVMVSYDGGDNFEPLVAGLPSTLVYDLAGNEDDSMLFAATEAGPYVYIADYNEWFDMSGLCAPTQTYWSVEYIESLNVVRFGTYGRGIWDFEIDQLMTGTTAVAKEDAIIKIYPNPTLGSINIDLGKEFTAVENLKIWSLTGQLIGEYKVSQQIENIDLTSVNTGIYFVKFLWNDKLFTRKIYKN